jgi:hypothetical protein
MKWVFLAFFITVCRLAVFGQAPGQKAPLPPHPNGPASEEIQTEKIVAPGQTSGASSDQASSGAYLEPVQVKALTHKIWLAEFRLNDLLTQVHPDQWKMAPAVRESFGQSLESLRKAMTAEEDWRSQFESRPESLYLGFQTYVAISAVVPRVDGVAHSVAQYVNPSFGAQYSQAANQFIDLQQSLEPHLANILKSQDGLLLAAQTNLASCQNELNFAERNKEGRATPMKNIVPEFKGRGRTARANAAASATKKSATKKAPASKSAASPAQEPQKK